MRRSEDPRIHKIVDRIAAEHPGELDYINRLLYRMDAGQIEHGDDYRKKNAMLETEQEIFDIGGWPIMGAYQYPEITDLVVNWFQDVFKFRRKFKLFKAKVDETMQDRYPEVALTMTDKVENMIRNGVDGDERY